MEFLGRIGGALFDGLLALLGRLSPGASLTVISLLLGLGMLYALRWFGDPRALDRSIRRMQAHMMEMRLFDREPKLVFVAMRRMFAANVRLLAAILKPTAVALVPMVLLFVQMEHYYAMRPLRPGESAIVTAEVDAGELAPDDIVLVGSEGVDVRTPAVRSPGRDLVSWQIRARHEGTHALVLRHGSHEATKSVTVSRARAVVSLRRASRPFEVFLYPVESSLDDSVARWIEVDYPRTDVRILGLQTHWLVWLFFISFFGAVLVRWAVNARRPETF
jgi:hypothetical protein